MVRQLHHFNPYLDRIMRFLGRYLFEMADPVIEAVFTTVD